jgi:hypothetical protein
VLTYAQKELLEGMVVDFDEIDTEGGYGFIFILGIHASLVRTSI